MTYKNYKIHFITTLAGQAFTEFACGIVITPLHREPCNGYNATFEKKNVTCKNCLKMMAKQ